jgi:hypothetical protein
MRRPVLCLLLASLATSSLTVPSLAAKPVPAAVVPASAAVSDLVAKVDIPHEQFTLPNGLRVIVHADHKASRTCSSI